MNPEWRTRYELMVEVAQEAVSTAQDVQSRIEQLKKDGRKSALLLIANAEGEAKRFLAVYEQYKKAPDVTRRRMYLETMERVLGPMDKTIVDQNSASPPVPYIALDPLQPKTGGVK